MELGYCFPGDGYAVVGAGTLNLGSALRLQVDAVDCERYVLGVVGCEVVLIAVYRSRVDLAVDLLLPNKSHLHI